ncbi:MAG: DUF3472 domain-containing protein [Planctomycetales bacterium]|nr:DUF3472 domain-containing protein [Planctomycetales bacterium]
MLPISVGLGLCDACTGTPLHASEWSVPLAGNSFCTAPDGMGAGLGRDGAIILDRAEVVFSAYFHVDRPAALDLAIGVSSRGDEVTITTNIDGRSFHTIVQQTNVDPSKSNRHPIGRVDTDAAGYIRVDFKIDDPGREDHIKIHNLFVSSETEGLTLDFVRSNEGNMFYWGRRGPSVHLRYEVPKDRTLQYAYSEITVPKGQDPIGSYFMANGFGEGYFGIQVNSPNERRVLFSVWSPFKTDNPRDIPEDQRIVELGKGPGVRTGEFGNEGSGGQSFLVYPWVAGKTYRFLTEVRPDGGGNTIYTSWFGDKAADEWRLIASFRRPKTDTHLRGFHSFLENFAPSTGYLGRTARYGNVWVRDTDNRWTECTKATFSVDATGRGRHRLDFGGGSDGDAFYLRNCGFFEGSGRPGEAFVRQSTDEQQPKIDFDQLPRQ